MINVPSIPKDFAAFISPQGQQALVEIERLLQAISRLQVVVTVNGVRQPAQAIKLVGGSAIVEIVVNT